jgi:DNA-binding NarL/FixJ family response regulator
VETSRHNIEVTARPPISVLIVDDDPLFADMLVQFLARDRAIEVTGVAWTLLGAIRFAREQAPDVVVLDAKLPDGDVAMATMLLRQLKSRPEVLLVSAGSADERVALALGAGATGYLPKQFCIPDIRTALRSLAARRRRRPGLKGKRHVVGSVELERR